MAGRRSKWSLRVLYIVDVMWLYGGMTSREIARCITRSNLCGPISPTQINGLIERRGHRRTTIEQRQARLDELKANRIDQKRIPDKCFTAVQRFLK